MNIAGKERGRSGLVKRVQERRSIFVNVNLAYIAGIGNAYSLKEERTLPLEGVNQPWHLLKGPVASRR